MAPMEVQLSLVLCTLFVAWLTLGVFRLFYNVFFHPLRAYPGPLGARATTWWNTYIEVVKQESMTDVKRRSCMKLSAKIIPSSGSAHMSRQNGERMCSSECSRGKPFLACKAFSDATYVKLLSTSRTKLLTVSDGSPC